MKNFLLKSIFITSVLIFTIKCDICPVPPVQNNFDLTKVIYIIEGNIHNLQGFFFFIKVCWSMV